MTVTGQDHEIWIGQDKILNITITTSAANIDGWTMAGYWVNTFTQQRDMTVVATIPTAGQKVARLTITDTLSDALNVPSGMQSVAYLFQFWRTDDASESPIATGTATVYRSLRP